LLSSGLFLANVSRPSQHPRFLSNARSLLQRKVLVSVFKGMDIVDSMHYRTCP
jgi:hypothetical protein